MLRLKQFAEKNQLIFISLVILLVAMNYVTQYHNKYFVYESYQQILILRGINFCIQVSNVTLEVSSEIKLKLIFNTPVTLVILKYYQHGGLSNG